MEVHIRKDLEPEIKTIVQTLKFANMEEFINLAVREKILELKKKKFIEISNKIAEGLRKSNIAEEEMLEEFEKRRE